MKLPTRHLPLVALALVAGVAGVVAASLTGGGAGPGGNGASSAEEAELAELQEGMRNTLVLPEDFREVPAFSLVGGDGEPIDQGFLEGRWTLAFFGFTHCPDVCPITLQVMKGVVAELESRGIDPMQVAFVSVDPERDTPERMGEYVAFFDEDFVGVTGEMGDVHALTSALGIVASFTANENDPESYTVDHTASMLLIDPSLRVRAKFNPPHEVESIVADYVALTAALS